MATQRQPNGNATADATHAVSVKDAADRLGLSSEAVRMRLRRGTLAGRKQGGGWVVLLPADPTADAMATEPRPHADATPDRTAAVYDELVASLRSEVEHLRAELAARAEESRRKDHIIAGLVQRVPELPAGHDGPTTRPEAPGAAEPPKPAGETLALRWRRWWRGVGR